jgi:hypothetical protein
LQFNFAPRGALIFLDPSIIHHSTLRAFGFNFAPPA